MARFVTRALNEALDDKHPYLSFYPKRRHLPSPRPLKANRTEDISTKCLGPAVRICRLQSPFHHSSNLKSSLFRTGQLEGT